MDRRDDSGLGEFVRTRSTELLRTAYLLTGDGIYAENLVRTALIRANLAGASFRDVRPAEVFVRKALAAMVMSRWWTLVWRRSRPGLEEPPIRTPRAPVEEAADRERLWDALQKLPPRQRVLVVAQYHDGLTETETAELTASTAQTVRARTKQVLNALHRQSEVDHPAVRWRDALEEVARPGAVAEDPADRVGRLLRGMFAERVAELALPTDWNTQTLRHARLIRRRRVTAPLAAAAVVLVAVVAGLIGPGMSTPEKPPATPTASTGGLSAALERLPAGSPLGVPYAAGRTIVLAPGRTVELPSEYREPGLFGLGGTRHGLLVVPFGIVERGIRALHVAADGDVTHLDTKVGWYSGHVISPDGRYAAWATRHGTYDEPAFAKIADLRTGEVIASQQLPPSLSAPTNDLRVPRIHDFDGHEALVVGSDAAGKISYARWNIADGRMEPQQSPAGLWASSLAADSLLATIENRTGDRCLVNVAISNHDHERWRLCDTDFVPYISPDASVVALRRIKEDPDHDPAKTRWDHRPISLEVRDLETGTLLARHDIDVPQGSLWAPTWESSEALLIIVRGSADQPLHLLRCPLSEHESCERVPIPVDEEVTAIAVQRWY